jgi:4a-hydroxytetrahydrobiopterin dehydratase
MPARLSDDEIARRLAGCAGWERRGEAIHREVQCPSFPDAIALVTRVAFLAEARDHHPDIDIRWRTVRFALSTHSEGGLTDLDFDLAAAIDALEA